MSISPEDREELRVEAKERMEDLPGETALGNPDPAAGGVGDPKTYEGNQAPAVDQE
ncbi:hypothetical protein [Actinoplanes sp. N902-109]|uniref:hypothetical protein n=1 Tax=Actinoplanes sp. (strain N902-109) TaxID=649831 RepID=UPI0003293F14|nr:hypothetical protein [Actinoplanes sp. N902-109]AGL18959.1 hypothetical protein L083_5449 [Actinoplanes sp. N902-109]